MKVYLQAQSPMEASSTPIVPLLFFTHTISVVYKKVDLQISPMTRWR